MPHFSDKQHEFIQNSYKKYNITHGAVRAGKTVVCIFRFIQEALQCPGNSIYLIGFSLKTIYQNVVSLLFDSEELGYFAPFCSWSKGNHILTLKDKTIRCIGAGDEGALGVIQGLSIDLCYCDEMTLYPPNVLDMIETRLSRHHSKLFASMNPSHPDHKIKGWIDRAARGDKDYYALHFKIDDNPFLPTDYKKNLEENISGLFYRRNILGEWCLAEGSIYDFFDKKYHVTPHPIYAADYYIAGIDVGTSNPFSCVLIGISYGTAQQIGKRLWVEKEYYWDPSVTNRQKTNQEFCRDILQFLSPYPLKGVYIDPSASAMKLELRKANLPVIDANNDVLEGIRAVGDLISVGTLQICASCPNLIRELQNYVWDAKKGSKGMDAPLKKNDHAVDALRYAIMTHRVPDPYKASQHKSPFTAVVPPWSLQPG